LRAGESGARIAPEPIDTRKKKESRACIYRTLSIVQCPTLLARQGAYRLHFREISRAALRRSWLRGARQSRLWRFIREQVPAASQSVHFDQPKSLSPPTHCRSDKPATRVPLKTPGNSPMRNGSSASPRIDKIFRLPWPPCTAEMGIIAITDAMLCPTISLDSRAQLLRRWPCRCLATISH
jgi:hypothetical protein